VSPFGFVVPAVVGLVMALVMVVWAVVAVILIGAVTLAVASAGLLRRA
jgi:hypothetical protein